MSAEQVPSHPVLEHVAALEGITDAALACVEAADPVWLTAAENRRVLVALTRLAARHEALRLRVLAAGQGLGDVAADDGSRDAAAWLAHQVHLDPGHARRLTRLATALEDRYAVLRQALATGVVDVPRAEVVVRALDDLPADLDPELRHRAEEVLVAQAEAFDPRRLRILGRRVLAHIAPDIAEAHEARALADEETHARAVAFLRTRRRGDGTTDLTARLPETTIERLLTYLHAFTTPRQPDTHGTRAPGEAPVDRRPHDQQLAHAFTALVETIDPHRMPVHGGDATTVMVTIDLATLTTQLDHAGVALIGDQPITAAHARRLACTAGIIPAVLGGDSTVLDLGRSRRLFSPAQRKALTLKHPTCAAHGCTIPAPWCEAHHTTPWSHGGPTDLDHGTLLCSHHHHRAHDPRYDTTHHPDGTIRYHRRT